MLLKRLFSNNTPKVCWRDKKGNIVCPGDDCPAACDDKCPIWLNTMGLQLLQLNEFEKAIETFKKAIELADDFVDVQNNLGTAYGMSNQHKEAYEAFKKAYEMRPKYAKALNGLIVSEIHLGRLDDALKHCDELDAIPGGNSKAHRTKIAAQSKPEANTVSLHMEIVAKLLEVGRDSGHITSTGMPFIPELMAMSVETCLKLIQEIREYGKTHPNADILKLSFAWAAYAGMGAVYHWHTDWSELSQKGVFETLTEERGVFAMDEYVLDTIGIPHEDVSGEAVMHFVMELATKSIDSLQELVDKLTLDTIIEGAKAMFFYGMVFEMNRLGMH